MIPKLPDYAWDWIIRIEGGDSDDPADRGGRTRYGISDGYDGRMDGKAGDLVISEIDLPKAKQFYTENFWLKYRCDKFPPYIAILMLDATINHRPRTAIRLVQKAVGAYADGVIGPKTLTTAKRASRRMVIDVYCVKRTMLFHRIVVNDPSQSRFLAGWFKRVFWLRDIASELAETVEA